MSSTTVSVKRHNHRVHPCELERKDELLNLLITRNAGQSILIVTANDPEPIQNMITEENIVVTSDTALVDSPELRCDLLISYDLPEKAIVYMTRLARTKTYALILLDPKEQKQLYPIEMLLGRNLLQEIISGFEPKSHIPLEKDQKTFRDKNSKRDYKPRQENYRSDRKRDDKTGRDDKRPPRKSYSSDSQDEKKSDKWEKKEGQPSRYIGKDENGKPIFSGRTRERNHRYDGTPRDNADKTTYKDSDGKPKFSGSDEKKNTNKPRSYDTKKREDTKEKKPWDKSKSSSSKKPYKSYDNASKGKPKPSRSDAKKPAPKRPPRTFKIKSLKQQEEKESE